MVGRFYIPLLAAALMMGAVACEKEPQKGGGAAAGQSMTTLTDSNINGTAIQSASDVAGLITNSKTGAPIAGVPVTDGYSFVVTDANGVYQMKRNTLCRKIYYTTPAEYKISLDAKNHCPAFYTEANLVSGKKYRCDFSLEPLAAVENNFSLVMVGDPQCTTIADMGRYKSETIADIKGFVTESAFPNAYAITLGDITHDATDMWPYMKASMSNCDINGRYLPFFQCIGNHDHNSLSTDTSDNDMDDYNATAKYVEMCGPTDYSFDRGQAHIVVMDDIPVYALATSSKPNGKTWNYNGGFSDAQWKWLQEDFANVKNPESKIFFICLHIPFRGSSSSGGANVNTSRHYADVLSMMTKFNEAHILIGHTHYPQNWIHTGYKTKNGKAIYEHIHQAACGSWWTCNSCVTGAPNGYNVFSVQGNTVADWVNKGTGHDASYQMRVYDGNQIYSGTKQYKYSWYNTTQTYAGVKAKGNTALQNAFVAEIWDDDDTNWKVELWQNGSKVGDFNRLANGGSCNIAIVSYYFNEKSKSTDTWTSSTASHYWYFVPTSKTPASEKNWEVRATQIIPSSGKVKTYTCNKLTTDYSEF